MEAEKENNNLSNHAFPAITIVRSTNQNYNRAPA